MRLFLETTPSRKQNRICEVVKQSRFILRPRRGMVDLRYGVGRTVPVISLSLINLIAIV